MWKKIQTWFWFTFRNPKVRQGESGGFKWCFRRLSMEIETLSGNFKAKFTAAEHPYGYLLAGNNDDNIVGFCEFMYMLSQLLTRDQGLVNDVRKAISKYEKRVEKQAAGDVVEDETQEKIALEEVKQVQEYVEMPKKERKKRDRDVNGRFVKAVKDVQKGADGNL